MTPQIRNWVSAILTTSVLVVLALVLAPFSVQRSADPFLERPSTFFTDPSGARALFLVMKELLPSAEQWRRPLNLLPLPDDPDSPATLIVAGPRQPIAKSEAEHLDRWLAAGGQLILASADGWPIAFRLSSDDAAKREADSATPTKENSTYLSRHAATIRWSKPTEPRIDRIVGPAVPTPVLAVESRQKFVSAEGAKIVASAGTGALAVEIPVGRGRIVALADPTLVSNRALGEADNAVWIVTLAAGWGNGKILIDEFHHGFGRQRSAGELTWAFLQTPWGWCALQLAAAGALYLFGYRRRFGRISELSAPERASPLELIDARAGFFQAAAAKGLAAELIAQNLAQNLAAARGKSFDIARLSRDGGDSAAPLARVRHLSGKAARGEKLTDPEFVEIGRIAGQIQQGLLR